MITLPRANIAGSNVRLPTTDRSALDLTRFLVAQPTGRERGSEVVRSLLASCPSLLSWTIAQLDNGYVPVSFSKLVEWFDANALATLTTTPGPPAPNVGDAYCQCDDNIAEPVRKYFRAIKRQTRSRRNTNDVDAGGLSARLAKILGLLTKTPQPFVVDWLQSKLTANFWIELAALQQDSQIRPRQKAAEWLLLAGREPMAEADELWRRITFRDEPDFQRKLHQEKMASLKQLAYGASHEINNPLANIASRAQTLLLDEHDEQRRRKLEAINQQAFRAHEMIADMMLFAHPPKPEITATDANELIEQVIREIEPTAEQQGTKLVWQATGEANIQADSTQLAVAIKALVQNALEALRESGQITISISPDSAADYLVIAVSDDGPGIHSEHQAHLFDPFFSGREAGRGLGFGLSKAWRIAELHRGSLMAKNRTPQGALFELRIPYAGAVNANDR